MDYKTIIYNNLDDKVVIKTFYNDIEKNIVIIFSESVNKINLDKFDKEISVRYDI